MRSEGLIELSFVRWLRLWHGHRWDEKQKQQQSIRIITILSLFRTVYPLGIVQRNAKRHSKCEAYYCHKVFQTSNIESEIKSKSKSKRKHLSCSPSLPYMAYSMNKRTPHLIFNQYESENERGKLNTLNVCLLRWEMFWQLMQFTIMTLWMDYQNKLVRQSIMRLIMGSLPTKWLLENLVTHPGMWTSQVSPWGRRRREFIWRKNKEIKVKVMGFEGLDDDISVSSIDSEIRASNVRISQHIKM